MKLVKKTAQYSIYQRGDDRYAVKDVNKKPVNGEEKARILVVEDLVKVSLPAKVTVEETPVAATAVAAESAVPAAAPVGDPVEELDK